MSQHALTAMSAPSATGPDAHEYLCFTLGDEHYAIDILRVREIRAWEPVTRIAHAPAFVRGVTNLRGEIVPIVDLRLRFGLADAECGPFTVVIVLDLGRRAAGVVVDAVTDVLVFKDADIQQAPAGLVGISRAYLRGLVSHDDDMLLVLDIAALMQSPEMGLIESAPVLELPVGR